MKNKTVAKRYALALFNIAKKENKFVEYGQELNNFSTALTEGGLEQILTPVYPNEVRENTLNKILEKATLPPMLNNFIKLLFDKGRLNIINLINQHYQTLTDEENKIARGTLSSAVMLKKDNVDKIESALSSLVGKKVELEVKIEPSLIGGLKAQLGDITIDGSIINKINQIDNSFQN